MNFARSILFMLMLCLPLGACTQARSTTDQPRWSIAIHGGAGTLDRSAPPEKLAEYKASLAAALEAGRALLARGASAMDACEAAVRVLEDDPRFNAGKGAAYNELEQHELDAAIMDGSTLRCGAVAATRTVKNPISLARMVPLHTRHILLMGDGAEEFATAMGVERVPNSYFDTEFRRKALEEFREGQRKQKAELPIDARFSTVGCVALDMHGRLAAATSTGGLTGKKFGRAGAVPLIGLGTYADATCAVSGTGTGEEFIRHTIGITLSARMKLARQTLREATGAIIFQTLKPDQGGIIAIDNLGHIEMPYNTEGMYRGAANSAGRFEVHIFED